MGRKFLNFVTFNVGSLVHIGRRTELNFLLNQFDIDIAFIQELHFSNGTNIFLDDFNVVKDSSPLGVGIALRKSIFSTKIVIPGLQFPSLFLEVTISFNGVAKKVLCGSIYFNSNCNRRSICDGLSLILRLSRSYDGLVLGGDLNAKHTCWGDLVNNFNGEVLSSWLQDECFSVSRICDTCPTFPRGSSHLDHFIISNGLLNYDSYRTQILPSFSDHNPLLLRIVLSEFDFLLKTPDYFTSYRDTDWGEFKTDIAYSLLNEFPPSSRNLTNEEIDYFIENFNRSVDSVSQRLARKVECRKRKFIPSETLRKILRIKYNWQNELRSIFTRTLNRRDPRYLLVSKQIDLIKIIIKERIGKEQAAYFNNRLLGIRPGPTAYKEIFQIIGNRNRSGMKDISINGTKIVELDRKLDVLRDHFASIFQGTSPDRDVSYVQDAINNTVSQVSEYIAFDESNTSLNESGCLKFIDLNSLLSISKMVNSKKSGGLDNISNFIIKKLPIKAFEYLTILFNNCLNNCYFPGVWKVAKIIPIKKQKGNIDINNFRPISLLSNIGKLFERVIWEKMNAGVDASYIPQRQFGFKKGNSTVHALLKFHNDIVENLRQRKSTVAVSLDVEKAFDKAYHDGMLFKMIQIGFEPSIVKLFQSFFGCRKFCVQVGDALSVVGDITCGVPQGSVLAPHLYSILIYDFPHDYNNSQGILYADDSLIYAHDESPSVALSRVSSHLRCVDEFYSQWGIKINAAKSNAICLRNASGKCKYTVVPESKTLKLALGDNDIEFRDNIKYLGVNFNKLLKFNSHVSYNLDRCNRVKGAFSRLFNSKYLPTSTKLLLYKVSIRPILLYAFPIWFTISKTRMKKLEIFERHLLRKCIEKNYKSQNVRFSNKYIYEKAKMRPLSTYALHLMRNFVEKLSSFEGSVIQDILSNERGFSWSNTQYISSIGILQEELNEFPGPNFYSSTTPGIHRG